MESKNTNELLEMVVDNRVIHPRIYVVERICDDGMSSHKVEVDAGRLFEGFAVDAEAAKVTDYEAFEFLGL